MTLNDLEWLFCVKICHQFGIYWFGVFWLSDKIAGILAELLAAKM